MPEPKKWMRLDNAAKIFPRRQAAGLEQCVPAFRHPDAADRPSSLQEAVRLVAPRFPSMLVSLHRGLFWYYLEQVPEPPRVRPDSSCPLVHMTSRELETCAPAGAVLPQPDCRGVLPLHHRRQRRPGVSQDSDSGLCLPARWHLHPTGGGSSGLAHAPGPSRVGRQLPEGGRSGFHEPPGGKCFRIQGPREQDGFLHLTVATVSSSPPNPG